MEESELKREEAEQTTEQKPADFLEKYASAAFHALAVKRGSGDKEAAEKIRRYVRHIEKKDPKPMGKYLRTANDNKNLESLRKGYGKMQTLSWISLILCALATFTVIGLMIFKPELLQKRIYQIGICGGAVLFAVLTWVFSGVGSKKARRMTELDLLLRVKDLPGEEDETEEAEEEETAEKEEEAAEDAPEESTEEATDV